MVTYGEASSIAPTDIIIGSFSQNSECPNKRTKITKTMGRIWGAIACELRESNQIRGEKKLEVKLCNKDDF